MNHRHDQSQKIPPLRLLAWETTRRCNLACLHCRAAAGAGPYPGELTTAEGKKLLDDLATMGQIVVILTGGEPLLRSDIFDLAAYGRDLGHRMVMAVNGTLLTPAVAARLKDAGIQRLSISIDGATAASHDRLRAVDGAYDGALAGIAACNEAGLPFQINTTVTRANRLELPAIHELALKLGAAAHHVFVLVPTGRGDLIREELVSPGEYEETLKWLLARQQDGRLFIKPTCAPQYYRLWRQDAARPGGADYRRYPRHGGHDQRLPGGPGLRLCFLPGGSPALRLPGTGGGEHQGDPVPGNLGQLRAVPATAPGGRLPRQVRRLPVPQGLRGLPGPGLRPDRGRAGG